MYPSIVLVSPEQSGSGASHEAATIAQSLAWAGSRVEPVVLPPDVPAAGDELAHRRRARLLRVAATAAARCDVVLLTSACVDPKTGAARSAVDLLRAIANPVICHLHAAPRVPSDQEQHAVQILVDASDVLIVSSTVAQAMLLLHFHVGMKPIYRIPLACDGHSSLDPVSLDSQGRGYLEIANKLWRSKIGCRR